jgi:hypothetical protein
VNRAAALCDTVLREATSATDQQRALGETHKFRHHRADGASLETAETH